jgi:hypothetical protein
MQLLSVVEEWNPWWRDPASRPALRFPVRRDLQRRLLDRLSGTRALIVTGARQVGKTVLLRQLAEDLLQRGWPAPNVTFFDFSDERLGALARDDRPTAREVTGIRPPGVDDDRPRVFLFDEIGGSANWDLWLKQAVDASRASAVRQIYVVTDSSATLLLGDARESGVGRWDEFRLETLSFGEFLRLTAPPGEAPEERHARGPTAMESFLRIGGFPQYAGADVDRDDVRRQLRADVADRAVRKDLARFDLDAERALELLAYLLQSSGAAFNADKCARDLDSNPRSVRSWQRHLEGIHLLERLERHPMPAAARLRQRPKLYAADHALIGAFAVGLDPLSDPDVRARACEAVVFRHLREVLRDRADVGYFASETGQEGQGDFIVRLAPEQVSLIEVTSATRVRPEKIARVRRHGERLKAARRSVIHGGALGWRDEGIELVPLWSFLLEPERVVFGEAAP